MLRSREGGRSTVHDFDLTGRVAIVTGGNRGIGRAIALALAQHGADVAIASRDEEKTATVVEELTALGRRALGVRCDVTRRDEIDAAVARIIQELGPPAIVVSNAGVGRAARPEDITDEDWAAVIDTNLRAPLLLAQAARPSMLELGYGKVINIGSAASLFGTAQLTAYSASKGGLLQLTRSIADAWARDNIQVNCILPGWVRTDLTAVGREHERFIRRVTDRTPAGRWGEPEDVSGAAVFLASHASDFVTGVGIPVDGGYSAKLI